MADRSTFGDNASTAANSSRAFGPQDSNELSHAFNSWKEKQLTNLQSLRSEVQQVTHGHPIEAVAAGAAVVGVVAVDLATHGALRGLAKEALPSIEKSLGVAAKFGSESIKTGAAFLKGDAALADVGTLSRVTMRADVDARLKAAKEIVEGTKPKSISMGDLDGWKALELKNNIQSDKVVRGLTADLKDSMATHTQIGQDLQIANRDLTQLSTELKSLKQLRSETVGSELTADSSPALKRVKAAQQNMRDLALEGSSEDKAGARRGFEAAQESFEKAKAAAPARIEQIEGVAGKPGLLPRVESHITALQAKSAEQLDTIGATAKQAQARIDSLKQNGAFEKPTSEEDMALRKREQQIGTPRPSSSILTQEERTGIAAPPVRPAEVKVVEKSTPFNAVVADKPVAARPFQPASDGSSVRFDVPVAEKPQPFVASSIKEAPRETPFKAVVKDAASTARETSGFADVDKSLLAAENKVKAFENRSGSLRNGLAALKDYTDSVSQVMRTEANADIRERVVADAVKNLDRLLQPLAPTGKNAAIDTLQTLNDDKKFMNLRTVIERRLSGIEKAALARTPLKIADAAESQASAEQSAIAHPPKSPEAAAVRRPETANLTPETRKAIEAFSKVQSELPAEAKVYAVRTDGSIVDVALPSSREVGATRVVPKRVNIAQINDLGAERVLGRNFGKENDIGGFVIVETKRDASGAEIIANANAVKAAAAVGRSVEPIPDQVISRVIGNVPEELTKPGKSFLDFVAKFKQQTVAKAAEK
ncbi:MAG: hypothetical protein P4L53_28600 [Candidatus Obscuribacterales bacterium]|nr:hypothetical protein [Candidatus Obscuribacterales bacterium]